MKLFCLPETRNIYPQMDCSERTRVKLCTETIDVIVVNADCVNSFFAERTGLCSRISIASLKAQIFWSVVRYKGLEHELG